MSAGACGHVLFFTSAAAFRAEKLCCSAGIAGARLVPVPRDLSSDCGVALRFSLEPGKARASVAAVEALLTEASVPFERTVAE
ncbi:MAG: hypothetical protein CVV51_06300 [Spirochaetae bacterium HGW-Spirochaetae-7]|jgi:hypothetical protein|nr:MAG: hypothetical protein CVV51_06300 [Spirochaetae bacterium HGW-Spirochaetae-7]